MRCPNCDSIFEETHGLQPDRPIDKTMAQLEAEISFIETSIEQLLARRAHLRREWNTFSPISQLPSEILTSIFRMTCQLSHDSAQRISPLFFGGICKDWRQIAWSTPSLWNRISFEVSPDMQIDLLGEWLVRAQSAPLSIFLPLDTKYGLSGSFCAVLQLLVSRAEHWESFDCLLPPHCHDILQNHTFPRLTSVSLRNPLVNPSGPPNIFLSSPKLVHVDLTGYTFSSMVLPWERLRSFTMPDLTIAQCLEVLSSSPALDVCIIKPVNSPEDLGFRPQMVHSDLKRLDVFYSHYTRITLLDNLTLPKLSDLTFRGHGNIILTSLSSLISRSSCDLERLTVQQSGMKDDEILAVLKALPSLVHLQLISFNEFGRETNPSVGFSDKIVCQLLPTQQGSYLLPRLVSLAYNGPVTCDSRLLVDMLSARWRHVSHYESEGRHEVSRLMRAEVLGFAGEIPHDVRADVDMLISEGMELKI